MPNPSRVHTLASRAADRLAAARQELARFVNAADPSEIIFVRGTTEGINLVAGTWGAETLKADDEIVLTVAEHSSNLMPWTRLARQAGAKVRVADVDDEGRPRLDQFKQMLSKRTRVVAFSHVSNVLGISIRRKRSARWRARSARGCVIDGAQGAPHAKIDVQDLGCDFYVLSGHKMLGPMATGVVWGRRDLLEAMPPYHVGSNMAHEVDFEHAAFEHGAQKFQAGTPDVAGPVGLAAAVRFFAMAGNLLQRHDDELVRHGLARLSRIPTSTSHRSTKSGTSRARVHVCRRRARSHRGGQGARRSRHCGEGRRSGRPPAVETLRHLRSGTRVGVCLLDYRGPRSARGRAYFHVISIPKKCRNT